MILRYVGSKQAIYKKIIPHFPEHKNFISFNVGSGGMFFNKRPIAKYNFLNDIDDNISNLFKVILLKKNEFKNVLETIPYHQGIWNWLKKTDFTDDIMKAIKFLYLNNFGFFGLDGTLKIECRTSLKTAISRIEKTFKFLNEHNCQFLTKDFRNVLKSISLTNKKDSFIYSDPPYLGSNERISYQKGWAVSDSIDLLDISVNCGINMAISEFDNSIIIKLAKERKLNIIPITKRKNIRNMRTEILITNYKLENK